MFNSFLEGAGNFFVSCWNSISVWAVTVLPTLIECIVVIVFGYWFSGVFAMLLRKALIRTKAGEELATFAGSSLRFVLRLLVVMWAISLLDINIVSVLTALSAVGITLGLALKDTITSFTSGFIIMSTRPFNIGDMIEINGDIGRVSRIEMMNTTLLTNDNKTLVIPNCVVTTSTVTNYTLNPERRIDLHFTVAADSDLEKVRSVMTEVASKSRYCLKEHEVVVGVVGVTASGVEFEVRTWIYANDYTAAGFDIRERMVGAFAENGIKAA